MHASHSAADKRLARILGPRAALGAVALFLSGCWWTTPSPIPGSVTLPTLGPPASYPANWGVSVTPNPFPATVNTTGITVTVKVTAAGGSTTIPGVPITVGIAPGADQAVTSMMDFGAAAPPATGRLVGANATGSTDNVGLFTFTLKATVDGDEDILTINVRPGPQGKTETFKYATTNP